MHTATTHRLLSALVEEGLLSFDPYAKTYHIGFGLLSIAETAQALAPDLRLRAELRPLLKRVAERTEETSYLSIRSGLDALCVDRFPGRHLPQANTLEPGARRPLGVGAGSLAILASLPDTERDDIIRANEPRYERYSNLSSTVVRSDVEDTISTGHAYNDARIIADVKAVGAPIFAADGHVVAAVSVAAGAKRLPAARRTEIVEIMDEEVRALARLTR